jgi:hypothetical protein
MERKYLYAPVIILALASGAKGQSGQLEICEILKADREANLVVVLASTNRTTTEIRTVPAESGDKPEAMRVKQLVREREVFPVTIFLGGVTPIAGDGKKLNGDQLWKKLTPKAAVVFGEETLKDMSNRKVFQHDAVLLIKKPGWNGYNYCPLTEVKAGDVESRSDTRSSK